MFLGASGGCPRVVLERCALGRGCRSVLAARLLPFLYFFLHRTGPLKPHGLIDMMSGSLAAAPELPSQKEANCG